MYCNLSGKILRKSLKETETKGEIVRSFAKGDLPSKVFFLEIPLYSIILT
jgi:hypothetical protein